MHFNIIPFQLSASQLVTAALATVAMVRVALLPFRQTWKRQMMLLLD